MKKKKATLHTHNNSAPTEDVRPWHCQSSRTRLCRRPHSSWRDATRERRRWPVGCQIINMSRLASRDGGKKWEKVVSCFLTSRFDCPYTSHLQRESLRHRGDAGATDAGDSDTGPSSIESHDARTKTSSGVHSSLMEKVNAQKRTRSIAYFSSCLPRSLRESSRFK